MNVLGNGFGETAKSDLKTLGSRKLGGNFWVCEKSSFKICIALSVFWKVFPTRSSWLLFRSHSGLLE